MNTIFVFDIDDTLVLHTKDNNHYYQSSENKELRKLLDECPSSYNYIYTNGTNSHGEGVTKGLHIRDKIKTIFARDTVPYMKPYVESFTYVNKTIQRQLQSKNNDIYFFDDILDNLQTAKYIGWKTIYISPNYKKYRPQLDDFNVVVNKYPYIDYTFPNIYQALLYFTIGSEE